jgi:hypothetical protein
MTHNTPVNEPNRDDSPATEDETRAALLDRSKRDFTPVNKLFVQAAPGSGLCRAISRPSPAARPNSRSW